MGVIYFVRHLGTGEIKIGYSGCVDHRMQWLIREVGPIELLAVILGSMRLEKMHHAWFGAYRLHGEWFAPGEELMSYIASLKTDGTVGVVTMMPDDLWDAIDFGLLFPTKEETTTLQPWLVGEGDAAARGLPLRPPTSTRSKGVDD